MAVTRDVTQLVPLSWRKSLWRFGAYCSTHDAIAMAAQDRLATLEAVRAAGISVCAGGIIGLGEGPTDRVGLLHQLATLRQHPESVPINALARPLCPKSRTGTRSWPRCKQTQDWDETRRGSSGMLSAFRARKATGPSENGPRMQVAVAGTPLEGMAPPSALDVVRCVAAARVLMPRSVVRLSAGRLKFSLTDQVRPQAHVGIQPGSLTDQVRPGTHPKKMVAHCNGICAVTAMLQ